MTERLTEKSIRKLVDDWYLALDRHDEFETVRAMVVDDGLEMRFPETTARGHAGFGEWYKAVTHKFFDELHVVTGVSVAIDGDQATVLVRVNWQASIWNPPAPRSTWLGFDADQTWVVVAGPSGPRIKTYVVNDLVPMAGSAAL
ncbi:nuclear transport factor 2 family protein [Kibdelosporangium phytohabitans]|uniref:SnoaL-like domain-containing protein n=1 Tax=Kibdelosporangium phytohabitans TaxID=860235 RepID=A0A0N9HVN3_9PSEU|nr:nuclear transport factor 2 family protein [Kibdelosporangium phytohabitans]ALG09187.1 hypothetical protein AOZ06_21760 [Kibdelosporangium phytohabitans]MBE1469586.1 ketosteroid isomerase-like protein [Kibdelosporangium phytohabitans]